MPEDPQAVVPPGGAWEDYFALDWDALLQRHQGDRRLFRQWMVPVAQSPGGGTLIGFCLVEARTGAEASARVRAGRAAGGKYPPTIWRPCRAPLLIRPVPAMCHYQSKPEEGD
jgi:hypothetical protein